ncbi:MAG: TetR/AcrR family transcriptional regulator [Bacteroidia bacterium]|nr:TetR/AcrR family transcriptional regulator [Bacteroidia bacterium]
MAKKNIREQKIIEATERVFTKVGFVNAKMEDIAQEAGITKVTLYSYFQSKENLQLAVTYKALQLLIDKYYNHLNEYRDKSGLESTLAIFRLFIEFCENNYLYSESLLQYFELIRSTAHGANKDKLTEALKESVYFRKIQDIQNLPFKLTVQEIGRGISDGSIKSKIDPMLITLTAWTASIGYMKVVSASGNNIQPLFNVDLESLKELQLRTASELLKQNTIIAVQ